MKQQVNLYNAFIIVAPKTLLTWRRLWTVVAIFSVWMLILAVTTAIKTIWLHQQANELAAIANQMQNTLTEKKREYPDIFFTDNVQNELLALQKTVSAKQKILDQLLTSIKFSDYLNALGYAATTNTWLDEINIDIDESDVKLTGKTKDMQALRVFMQSLAKISLFKDTTIEINQVDADQNSQGEQFIFKIAMVNDA